MGDDNEEDRQSVVSRSSSCRSSSSKPHKANDAGWEAIRSVEARDGNINLSHFKLLQRLGSGDIGSVYLSELRGFRCLFAMKVMDKTALAARNKLLRAATERSILEKLDHPFLPTLYAHFDTANFSCLIMEYCPGGDLHTLRQRQLTKRFDNEAVRFYAAEILLALEYLHMMGVVYRDLKPENVLVRHDGHIMLSDFDLSLICDVSPTVIQSPPPGTAARRRAPSFSSSSSSTGKLGRLGGGASPSCILPACVAPCTVDRPMPPAGQLRSTRVNPLPELVAEPTGARSMSFVGTHEYLAPEIISGYGHGSAVDWWTLGIFLFEMFHGRTPFKGGDNESTLVNVLTKPLEFGGAAEGVELGEDARSLIRGLLAKDPAKRIASARGAVEIKQHPFFAGTNWALVRCAAPPEVPKALLWRKKNTGSKSDDVEYF
ncbi:hypothetical protein SELMODRAFT_89681 [Selaginella moellendorffii]|uniref:non-specific serine/threonine protein kinase n=1 Tax=Selaginella moellendorffii TaxID=88036 RepID=D8RAV4_SELML|nr:serine/threonine-protein kinase D6PKL2 [Selaginella moellendorffii]EFJ30378.1 hypothetical protein SELMODRAFT_89681 [Selaginella moellendorffii]|eukprot:XP_002968124.1 serine/threonine-protein kinase D6PKL2 [Selaginella moellendorffii]